LTPDGKTAVFSYGNEPSESGNVNPTADIAGRSQSILALDLATAPARCWARASRAAAANPSGCTQLAVSSDGVHVAMVGERGLRIATLAAASR